MSSGFQQVLIGGYPSGGLTQDRKPALLANEAYSDLENAYVWRERTKKRDGETPVGRLTRALSMVTLTQTGSNMQTIIPDVLNDTSINLRTSQPNAQIAPKSLVMTFGTATFTDVNGTGVLTITGTGGVNGVIHYNTGLIDVTTSSDFSGTSITVSFSYYPMLPVMGILKRDISTIGIDSTVFFDTKYAYQYVSGFQQLGTAVWTGSNTNFFWGANYQGTTPNLRYFFVTNNNITFGATTPYDPIRYYDNSAWTALQPLVDSANKLWQALIIIPYYGRLLALNTWEGLPDMSDPTLPSASVVNYFSRCRFSQIGNPIDQTNSWRSDLFGRGGFLDAPTNEAIVSAAFFRNTLVVFFEYSTWQLSYVGEYGLPFIWERISSDFGAISPYSPIVFNQGVMAISDRGIIQASAGGVSRLDEQIPEEVFAFEIQNNAPNFVHGVRDFEKELVYWNYISKDNDGIYQDFPNTVLVFNYKNNTWAKFRDTITCFGVSQFQFGITWDSLTTFWDSSVSWESSDDQNYIEYVTAGNQLGFINIYQNKEAQTLVASNTSYAPTLAITAIDLTKDPNEITIPDHNLKNDEIIYIQNTSWTGSEFSTGADPGFNNVIFSVTVIDENTIILDTWNFVTQNYDSVDFPDIGNTYIGNGIATLFPKMNIQGKDFNPFQSAGKQFKLSFIDFQMDANVQSPAITATTIQLFVNSFLTEQANLISTNQELINSSQPCGYITYVYTGTNEPDNPSNPCQVTSPNHSLITGTEIYIGNVQGTTEINSSTSTDTYIITVVDSNNFTLNAVDATLYDEYIKGGIWNVLKANGQTYTFGSQYAWYRFYSTQFGQYLRIGMTYDDNLMNQLATHQTPMELNAMNIWFRPGGSLFN